MKKDHNLDDLIIDDIKPDRSKGKGVLTIIALLIILLIAAIIMTRFFLGESDQNTTMVEQGQDELISPELKLDTSEHNPDADKKELEQLSSMMEEALVDKKSGPEKSQPQTARPQEKQAKPEEKQVKAEVPQIKPETVQVDEEAERVKPVPKVNIETVDKPAPKTAEAPARKPVSKPQHGKSRQSSSYYIQVGSFSKKPSSRFLSVISRSGFRYELRNGKLLIGPYRSDAAARGDLPRVKSKINKGAFIKHF